VHEFLSDFGAFLSAVFWRWQSWAGGGGLGGAVVVFIALYEHVTAQNVGKRMYLSIVVGTFLLGAFFIAWRDQHRALVALQNKLRTPEFELKGQSVWWGTRADKRFLVTVIGAMTNAHGPTSATIDWKMKLVFPNRTVLGDIPSLPTADISVPLTGKGDAKLVLKIDKYWPNTTNPIQAGAFSEGWFMAFFKDVTEPDVAKNRPKIVMSCFDVLSGKEHFFDLQIGGSPGVKIPGE
jgi:hypothetical protein